MKKTNKKRADYEYNAQASNAREKAALVIVAIIRSTIPQNKVDFIAVNDR